jgi:hypothetical protein
VIGIMKFIRSIIFALVLGAPVPALAQAKIDFAAYEGPPLIEQGEGGTKITKNGIDYWTTGTPPRRYQIIGFVQDRRDEFWDGGQAIGSPKIAKKVKAAGGDAVIIQTQEEAGQSGGLASGNPFYAWGMSGGSKTITRMLVVRYLPDEAAPTAPLAAEE